MTISTLKRILDGPDREIVLPNEVSTKILMKLDGRSLHTAQQVSKDWNSLIKAQVLGTVEVERTLQHQWREATPAKSVVTIEGLDNPMVLAITDKFAVV